MEAKYLKKFDWQVLIVDEGHRLKNAESKSANVLSDYKVEKIRILLTGMTNDDVIWWNRYTPPK